MTIKQVSCMAFKNQKKKISELDQIPDSSIILNGFGKVDYHDTYKITISTNKYSVDKIASDLFKLTPLFKYLLKIRDFIVKPFGIKTSDEFKEAFKTDVEAHYSIGSKAVFFTVIDRNEKEIVMAENDKHLNFKTSVMIEKKEKSTDVYQTTIVQYNNFFGRFYFFFVKPFHRFLIKKDLKKYANEN